MAPRHHTEGPSKIHQLKTSPKNIKAKGLQETSNQGTPRNGSSFLQQPPPRACQGVVRLHVDEEPCPDTSEQEMPQHSLLSCGIGPVFCCFYPGPREDPKSRTFNYGFQYSYVVNCRTPRWIYFWIRPGVKERAIDLVLHGLWCSVARVSPIFRDPFVN